MAKQELIRKFVILACVAATAYSFYKGEHVTGLLLTFSAVLLILKDIKRKDGD